MSDAGVVGRLGRDYRHLALDIQHRARGNLDVGPIGCRKDVDVGAAVRELRGARTRQDGVGDEDRDFDGIGAGRLARIVQAVPGAFGDSGLHARVRLARRPGVRRGFRDERLVSSSRVHGGQVAIRLDAQQRLACGERAKRRRGRERSPNPSAPTPYLQFHVTRSSAGLTAPSRGSSHQYSHSNAPSGARRKNAQGDGWAPRSSGVGQKVPARVIDPPDEPTDTAGTTVTCAAEPPVAGAWAPRR